MKKVRWRWTFIQAVAILFCAPFVMMLLPAGTEFDQDKLDRITADLVRLEARCENQKLKDVLGYTARRYNRVERGGVTIHPMRFTAGLNAPWCPGLTIDAETWGYCDDVVLQVLVHEAMHDYPPYFFHRHMEGWVITDGFDGVTELERLIEVSK
jgi:hypothetical protein